MAPDHPNLAIQFTFLYKHGILPFSSAPADWKKEMYSSASQEITVRKQVNRLLEQQKHCSYRNKQHFCHANEPKLEPYLIHFHQFRTLRPEGFRRTFKRTEVPCNFSGNLQVFLV